MYAIIKTGGKQYKVSEGDVIRVEKLEVEGDYTFNEVLAISKDDALTFGTPTVSGASVSASVVNQGKHKKVIVYKFKKKKGFHKKKGHRQPYTELKINSING
ncbi:MAG: 50S ribosomal protein L21 [Defluviitaleaceae bacterium]|nr:50S ribosomal protein L21 [Defluviitaleaceae bacterium]